MIGAGFYTLCSPIFAIIFFGYNNDINDVNDEDMTGKKMERSIEIHKLQIIL